MSSSWSSCEKQTKYVNPVMYHYFGCGKTINQIRCDLGGQFAREKTADKVIEQQSLSDSSAAPAEAEGRLKQRKGSKDGRWCIDQQERAEQVSKCKLYAVVILMCVHLLHTHASSLFQSSPEN